MPGPLSGVGDINASYSTIDDHVQFRWLTSVQQDRLSVCWVANQKHFQGWCGEVTILPILFHLPDKHGLPDISNNVAVKSFFEHNSPSTPRSGLVRYPIKCQLQAISHFRKLLIAVRFALATQPITAASSINPNTGMASGIRSNGLRK
jgi:hypothetical protein